MKSARPVATQRSRTAQNILEAAIFSFGTKGYEVTSLDQIAASLHIRKQTILYWYPSKELLLDAAVDRIGEELAFLFEKAIRKTNSGWDRIEAVVRSIFNLAARRPEVLGLVREVGRLGAPASDRLTENLGPLMDRATQFLKAEMDAGLLRPHDARFFLLSAYSVVIGVATEVEVLRALGMELSPRSLVLRRNELLGFLKSALKP